MDLKETCKWMTIIGLVVGAVLPAAAGIIKACNPEANGLPAEYQGQINKAVNDIIDAKIKAAGN